MKLIYDMTKQDNCNYRVYSFYDAYDERRYVVSTKGKSIEEVSCLFSSTSASAALAVFNASYARAEQEGEVLLPLISQG